MESSLLEICFRSLCVLTTANEVDISEDDFEGGTLELTVRSLNNVF